MSKNRVNFPRRKCDALRHLRFVQRMRREVRQIIQGDGVVSLRGDLAGEFPQFVFDRHPSRPDWHRASA